MHAAPSTSTTRRQPGGDREGDQARREQAERDERELAGRRQRRAAPGEAAARPALDPRRGRRVGEQLTTIGWTRPSTWPWPNGTGVGNSRPTGHSSSSASPPALRAMNQWSRSDLPALDAAAPVQQRAERDADRGAGAFRPRSTFDATRCGRKFCSELHRQRQQRAAARTRAAPRRRAPAAAHQRAEDQRSRAACSRAGW